MRLSALGDVTNALACVTTIKEHFKTSRIIWFVGKIEHQLLNDTPGIEFEVIDKKHPFKEHLRLKKKFKSIRFDVLLHMQRSLRCSLIVKALRAKKTVGFDSERARELQWLFTNEKIGEAKSPHAVDVFMEFAFKIGVPKETQARWDFGSFSSDDEVQELLQTTKNYIAIVVCGSQKDRAWSANKNAELIEWILSNTIYKVCLIGGPSEFEKNHSSKIVSQLNNMSDVAKDVINLVGKTDLKMLKTIIKKAKALVSPDTGPIHISSALDTPTVGLYVHMPKEITGPYKHLDLTVDKYSEALKLYYNEKSPNTFRGIPKRIKGHDEAINLIEVSEVIGSLKKALGHNS
jgi:heptosyltransferase I